ncbi:MAG: hypothetical protein IJP03_00700, partial [Christensenellaceae bacterium]|nr:hypothetical protein [Christensenellaceae bacterium]
EKRPKEIVVTGGGINSPVVAPTLADIFEADILTIDISDEVGSIGGAITAGYGVGIFPDILQAKKIRKITGRVKPIAENTAFFKERMKVLDAVYRSMEPLYPAMD